MTLEEKAEEYAYNTYTHSKEAVKQAYIAGAKENGIVWHKVADGDLPKEENLEMQVLSFTTEGYRLLSLFSDPKPIFDSYKVLAWCECPTYKEIEE